MIKNYFKIALRNIMRQKGFSFINIMGLAIGLACAIFILIYVEFERSYDTFHEDSERIYRIANEQTTSNGLRLYASVTLPMGPTIRDQLPQVEMMARIVDSEPQTVRNGIRAYIEERLTYADPEILRLFSIGLVRGNWGDALTRPLTAVITERMAAKYFGDEDPVGKFLEINGKQFEVEGIIADSPQNTHVKFSIIRSFATFTLPDPESPLHSLEWNTGHAAHTYVKLRKNTDLQLFQAQINQIAYDNLKDQLAQYGYKHHYFLHNIEDIHLRSHLRGEIEAPGNPQYLVILTLIGVFILLIACINFTNLSTARSAIRSSEIGIRKVVGAARKQLIVQIMGESMLMTAATLILACIIVVFTMNAFNSILETHFELQALFRIKIILFLVLLGLITGVTSGIYPAFLLSGFMPATIFKKSLIKGKRGAKARRLLVIGQIVISTILLIGTLVIHRQIHFMKNHPLGFDKEQKLIVNLPQTGMMTDNYTTIKSEFLKHHSILGVSASSSIPGRGMFFWRLWPTGMREEKSQPLNFINVDYDFIDMYELDIIAGRSFDRTFGSDLASRGWVVNESTVEAYGWESPEHAVGMEMMEDRSPIIGVVRDFHFKGLQSAIEPLAISVWSDHFSCFTLEVSLIDLGETISYIRGVIEKFFPEVIFNYFFLDDDFDRQYRIEERMSRLFGVFTFLGILIAVLGLFGLTAFIAEQRTKEIGIRKVFGATVFGVIIDFLMDFGKWVLVANIIAWPIAYVAMNKWLQNFAYRTSLNVWIFLLSGLATLAISWLTVSYQALKAATTNPVEALRYE